MSRGKFTVTVTYNETAANFTFAVDAAVYIQTWSSAVTAIHSSILSSLQDKSLHTVKVDALYNTINVYAQLNAYCVQAQNSAFRKTGHSASDYVVLINTSSVPQSVGNIDPHDMEGDDDQYYDD